jgi:hypothetical protein
MTSYKMKVLSEDMAVCVLDEVGNRLLIDGCAHRYVVCARDVLGRSAVATTLSSSVWLWFRVGEAELALVLSLAGQGPVQSILEAIAPGVLARRMLRDIEGALGLR